MFGGGYPILREEQEKLICVALRSDRLVFEAVNLLFSVQLRYFELFFLVRGLD